MKNIVSMQVLKSLQELFCKAFDCRSKISMFFRSDREVKLRYLRREGTRHSSHQSKKPNSYPLVSKVTNLLQVNAV